MKNNVLHKLAATWTKALGSSVKITEKSKEKAEYCFPSVSALATRANRQAHPGPNGSKPECSGQRYFDQAFSSQAFSDQHRFGQLDSDPAHTKRSRFNQDYLKQAHPKPGHPKHKYPNPASPFNLARTGRLVAALSVLGALIISTLPAFARENYLIEKPSYQASDHEPIPSGRFGQGYKAARLPKTTDEARQMGFYTEQKMWPTKGGKLSHLMWVRDIEIVPPGEKPGVSTSKYYVMQDQDFVDPQTAARIAAPTRTNMGFSSSPTFRYTTELDRHEYLPKLNEVAEVAFFRGSNRNGTSDKGFYYCINPNAYDPPYRYDYFLQSTRYSPQTNFQYLPELPYMLQTLLSNAQVFKDGAEKDPNWQLFYYVVKADYELYAKDIDNVNNPEASTLDPRLTRGGGYGHAPPHPGN